MRNRADYRELITLTRRSQSQNEYGEQNEFELTVYKNVFAAKEPLLGNEFYQSLTTGSKVEAKFRLHYHSVPISDDEFRLLRIVWKNQAYEILSASNIDSADREWLIYAKKVR